MTQPANGDDSDDLLAIPDFLRRTGTPDPISEAPAADGPRAAPGSRPMPAVPPTGG